MEELIVDLHNHHLQVGLIAQLLEHYTDIASQASSLVQAWIF